MPQIEFVWLSALYIVLTFFILPLTAYNSILNWPMSKAWYLGSTGVMERPYLWSQRDLTSNVASALDLESLKIWVGAVLRERV